MFFKAMRVYLSVPIITNRNKRISKVIASIIREMGHEIVSNWVIEDTNDSNVNIFERDTKGVMNSDILVAYVSRPSTGVGMEIMLAHFLGKKVILVSKKGSKISRMLLHMHNKVLVEFQNTREMREMLKKELARVAGDEGNSFRKSA
jgi:nucleoside 2-deoxyribosyltransferase